MSTPVENGPHGLELHALRSVREHRGLSQEELAELAGMTRATVANLEHGATRARPSSVYRLAEALRVNVDALTGEAPLQLDDELPRGVLTEYFEAAMRHATYRRAGGEQERVYAAIPGISGIWARGFTREEAERDLREALEWFVLTAVVEHRPLPRYDDASLEIVEESKRGTVVIYPEAEQTEASFLDGLEPEA